MITLKGENIYLRALEPEDLDFIYEIENNEDLWEVSNTQTPYSRFLIRQYLENAHQDIYEAKQLRLVICKNNSKETVGLLDFFDFDPKNNRAGVGIVIASKSDRNTGIGTETIQLIIKFAFQQLQLHQIYANINANNCASQQLFTNFGFQKIGIKKDWIKVNHHYQDEFLYQLIYNP